MNTMIVAVLLSFATTPGAAPAEPLAGRNAALRYWMAFASMENPPANEALATRLEAVSEGAEPWDESLADVLDRNRTAIETMHRGSRLPFCDWGLEDEMLADAPIAHVARGRALARLNVVYARRLLHRGEAREAVEASLAGLRFSRHLAEGGPWISALVASGSLAVHLRVLEDTARAGKLDAAARRTIERELAAMPEDGFDWGAAVQREANTLSGLAAQIAESPDPVAMLGTYFDTGHGPTGPEEIAALLGLRADQLSDREAVRAALHRTRAAVDQLRPLAVAAFREPYEAAVGATRDVDARAAEDPTLARIWPRSSRMNESRGGVVQARADVLALVRAR